VVHERGAGIAWRIWPSAHYLLDFIVRNQSVWEDDQGPKDPARTHILELGAGVGLVGICCAAQLHVGRVTLTDLVLEPLVRSVEANEVQVRRRLSVERLSWGEPLPQFLEPPAASQENADAENHLLVVASDCVYWESLAAPLADTLHRLCARGAVAYIAQRKRDWRTERRFFTRLLRQRGLRAEVVSQAMCVELEADAQAGEARIHSVPAPAPAAPAGLPDSAAAGSEGEAQDAAEWNTRIYKVTQVPTVDPAGDGGPAVAGRQPGAGQPVSGWPERPESAGDGAGGAAAVGGRKAKEKKKRGKVPPRQQKNGRWH
jgi:predicted nicotinamide N-methyase